MDQFPPLSQWFEIITNKPTKLGYVRHDLRLKPSLSGDEYENLINELCLLIGRLRLTKKEYQEWVAYIRTNDPISGISKTRFKNNFWRSFVSSEATKDETKPQFDTIALQGHLGEIFLYLIEIQLCSDRIGTSPSKPKRYSKDSGIDCLAIGGKRTDETSLYYTVWECKATTQAEPESFPSKIYAHHLYETPKSLNEFIDHLAELYKDDLILSQFVAEIADDFYADDPTTKKRLGGCVVLSNSNFVGENAFAGFKSKFKTFLAPDDFCRQVRFCSVKDLDDIVNKVRDGIWNKLLP